MANIVSVTMSLLNIKDLAVAISTRAGPAQDDPPLYINEAPNWSRLFVVKERVELLIEMLGGSVEVQGGLASCPGSTSPFSHRARMDVCSSSVEDIRQLYMIIWV